MRFLFLLIGWFWLAATTNYEPLMIFATFAAGANSAYFMEWSKTHSVSTETAFWVWRNLSGGKTPFYASPKLKKFQAPTPPEADAWRGWKLKLWNKATDYLVGIGELTHTPTLREKF